VSLWKPAILTTMGVFVITAGPLVAMSAPTSAQTVSASSTQAPASNATTSPPSPPSTKMFMPQGSPKGTTYPLNPTPSNTTACPGTSPNGCASVVGVANDHQFGDAEAFWTVRTDGTVEGWWDYYGTMYNSPGSPITGVDSSRPIAGIVSRSGDGGFWLFGTDGGVFAYGTAGFYGSMGGQTLNAQIVALVPTLDQGGYWLIGADGGVFNFGDAPFLGSLSGHVSGLGDVIGAAGFYPYQGAYRDYCMEEANGLLSCFGADWPNGAIEASQGPANNIYSNPITSMVPTSDGFGWWFVTRQGQVYPEGSATQQGQLSSTPYGPILGGSGQGTNGYRLVGADGGVFNYGSTGAFYPGRPTVYVTGSGTNTEEPFAQQIAHVMLPENGYGLALPASDQSLGDVTSQWNSLYNIWLNESTWNWWGYDTAQACNPPANNEYAYGIPQSCNGKVAMGSAGPDPVNNVWTQIMWGLSYIHSRYGDPNQAWSHWQHVGTYIVTG
jgi:hypothetical protein